MNSSRFDKLIAMSQRDKLFLLSKELRLEHGYKLHTTLDSGACCEIYLIKFGNNLKGGKSYYTQANLSYGKLSNSFKFQFYVVIDDLFKDREETKDFFETEDMEEFFNFITNKK